MLLGDPKSNAIYALKRIGWPLQVSRAGNTGRARGRGAGGAGAGSGGMAAGLLTINVSLMLPPGIQPGLEVSVFVVSDGYPLEVRQSCRISDGTIGTVEVERGPEKK